MSTFILIHGAWHGGWCWERIVPLLTQKHRVLAPDLPGMGKDGTALSDITLDLWARFVCDLVHQQNEKVILVGHSRGGVVISQAAEYCADKIQGLIYLAAFLLPNAGTMLNTIQQHPNMPKLDFIFSPDHSTSRVPQTKARDNFYNTCPEIWAERAISLLGPEPMVSFATPLVLSETAFGQIPRTYIECLQDKAVPITLQRKMLSALPCKYVTTLDTDHSPFYSAPEDLASHLIQHAEMFNLQLN